LRSKTSIQINGGVGRIGGNIDQAGFDQMMGLRIDHESQHACDDQRAEDQVDDRENIENNLP